MSSYKKALLVLFTLLLTACFIPKYQAKSEEETAQLKISKNDNALSWACISGKPHSLVFDSSGYAKIPAGQRLTLGLKFDNYVYQGVSTYCNPRASIIPEAGKKYFQDLEIEAERCTAFIYRETISNKVGLDFDETFKASRECSDWK